MHSFRIIQAVILFYNGRVCKVPSQWYTFDDSRTYAARVNDITSSKNVYALFYVARNKEGHQGDTRPRFDNSSRSH